MSAALNEQFEQLELGLSLFKGFFPGGVVGPLSGDLAMSAGRGGGGGANAPPPADPKGGRAKMAVGRQNTYQRNSGLTSQIIIMISIKIIALAV